MPSSKLQDAIDAIDRLMTQLKAGELLAAKCAPAVQAAPKPEAQAAEAGAPAAAPAAAPAPALAPPADAAQPKKEKKKKEKPAQQKDKPAAAEAALDPSDVANLDIRVGQITSCQPHPDADALYVETIDLGEPEGPRTIVSGLVKFVPLEAMQDRMVIVLANLKPRTMRGVKSNGMVLCASNAEHTKVEPLTPPPGAAIGERVYFGQNGAAQAGPASASQVDKKKIWEACMPQLRTDASGVASYDGLPMLTSAGAVTVSAASLANSAIA